MILLLLCSQYLKEVPLPIPIFNRTKRCHIVRVPVFKLFPVSYLEQTVTGVLFKSCNAKISHKL